MTDEFQVVNHILFDFLPHLWFPTLLGLVLIGFVTRFARNLEI